MPPCRNPATQQRINTLCQGLCQRTFSREIGRNRSFSLLIFVWRNCISPKRRYISFRQRPREKSSSQKPTAYQHDPCCLCLYLIEIKGVAKTKTGRNSAAALRENFLDGSMGAMLFAAVIERPGWLREFANRRTPDSCRRFRSARPCRRWFGLAIPPWRRGFDRRRPGHIFA